LVGGRWSIGDGLQVTQSTPPWSAVSSRTSVVVLEESPRVPVAASEEPLPAAARPSPVAPRSPVAVTDLPSSPDWPGYRPRSVSGYRPSTSTAAAGPAATLVVASEDVVVAPPRVVGEARRVVASVGQSPPIIREGAAVIDPV